MPSQQWHRFLKGIALKYLFLGYGNVDRQDDGVAWHLLCEIMRRLGAPVLAEPEDEMPVYFGDYAFDFQLQLTPELADDMDHYDRVCLMDAHTGNIPEEVRLEPVTAQYQSSPFTHHMTAGTLLSLCQVLHQHTPETILVSVRGYEFKFTRSLSADTGALISTAADQILEWMSHA
jgi:hydrogenase maturation protease